jgi:transcriptional regulator GlxA family with amidase domain
LAERGAVRTVVFLAAPKTQILDVTGPFQVFVRASELFVQRYPKETVPYKVVLASVDKAHTVQTTCGLVLSGGVDYRTIRGRIDTLLIAGGKGFEVATRDEDLLSWLRNAAKSSRRFGSICTGAFLLASAGLLDNRRVTTHWKWAPELADRCKRTTVDPDPIYIRDGKLYTSAGVTAGMDLALAMVEEDLGSPLALEVARELVMYLRRAGGQSQFSTALALQASDRRQIEELLGWAVDHLNDDLSVASLASRAGMSQRNFARVFADETGTPPGEFVHRIRVEAARRRLEESDDKLQKIAADCGFGSVNSLRRSFFRVLRVVPSEYRSRFTATSSIVSATVRGSGATVTEIRSRSAVRKFARADSVNASSRIARPR